MERNEKLLYYQHLADAFLNEIAPYPAQRFAGKGIVICGGGERYFTCAWIAIHRLRDLGCTLPIELWHLGVCEWDVEMEKLISPLGVDCIDASEVLKKIPVENLINWELKPYAVLHSRFKEVLYIDADNFVLRNPEFLFSTTPYLDTGALFWPDRYRGAGEGVPWLKREAWLVCRIPFRDEPLARYVPSAPCALSDHQETQSARHVDGWKMVFLGRRKAYWSK